MQAYPDWGYGPPTRGLRQPFIKVRGPRMYEAVQGWILGHYPWTGMIHYDIETKRSFPCPGEVQCHVCGPTFGKRRKGFLAACSKDCRELFIAELTSGALDQLEAAAEERGTLRGLGITLERAKDKHNTPKRNGKVLVKTTSARDGLILPPAFDVVPHVARSWGFDPASIAEFLAQLPPAEHRLSTPDELKKLREQLEGGSL